MCIRDRCYIGRLSESEVQVIWISSFFVNFKIYWRLHVRIMCANSIVIKQDTQVILPNTQNAKKKDSVLYNWRIMCTIGGLGRYIAILVWFFLLYFLHLQVLIPSMYHSYQFSWITNNKEGRIPGSCWHNPIVVTYWIITVLYSFERGSELE